ncbi:MAG: hypothetical protein P1U40_06220 [Coxiellaceae bacterium]|nr:hypothetical protein [Coxiellaceae bacterium]
MKPMIVGGLGPAGNILISALAKMKVPVIGIEMREWRIRPQVLTFMEESLRMRVYAKAGVRLQEDSQQIKDLEKDVDRVVNSLLSVDAEGKPCVIPGKICMYKPYKVIAIDRELSQITIQHVKTEEQLTLDFQHLFLCDGEARRMVRLLNDPSVTYRIRAYQPLHASFALPLLETPARRHPVLGGSIQFRDNLTPEDMAEILEQLKYLQDPDDPDKNILAWDRAYLPLAYTYPHGSRKTKHKINCEFLVEEADPRRRRLLVEQWGRKVLHLLSRYQKKRRDVFGTLIGRESDRIRLADISLPHVHDTPRSQAKHILRMAATRVQLDCVNQPTINMTADGVSNAILVGGSAFSAWFTNANGARSAMECALAAAECLDPVTGAWDAARYAARINKLVERADKQTKSSNDGRLNKVDEQMALYMQYAARQTEKPLLAVKGRHGQVLLTLMDECKRKVTEQPRLADNYQLVIDGLRDALVEIRVGKQYLVALCGLHTKLRATVQKCSTFADPAEKVLLKALGEKVKELYLTFSAQYKAVQQSASGVEAKPEPEREPALAPEREPALAPEREPALAPEREPALAPELEPAPSVAVSVAAARAAMRLPSAAVVKASGDAESQQAAPTEEEAAAPAQRASCCGIM